MFCKIKNRECSHAGELKTEGCKEWGEEEGIHSCTICYREGGRLACTLDI